MDASNVIYIKFDTFTPKQRIQYYLGPLYNSSIVNTENLISIQSEELLRCEQPDDRDKRHEYFLKVLTKYGFENKKISILFGDIQHTVSNYTIVKNRHNGSNSGVIIKKLNFNRHWQHVYNKPIDIPFQNKHDKIIWRGGTTGNINRIANRFDLITKWYNKNSNIDVGFSEIVQDQDAYKKYIKTKLSIDNLLQYKYLISVEGNDKDSGLNWKLASNSLVMMARPTFRSWLMEDMLIPNYHYLLLKNDFSDLLEKLEWCNKHPDEVLTIIKHANQYMEMFNNIKQEEDIEKKVLELYFKKTTQL